MGIIADLHGRHQGFGTVEMEDRFRTLPERAVYRGKTVLLGTPVWLRTIPLVRQSPIDVSEAGVGSGGVRKKKDCSA
jgi:hypothetical protein